MSGPRPRTRGGATVGQIDALEPVEAGAILSLRLWSDGTQARAQMARDFALALGDPQGARIAATFNQLCELCARHGRRPLMRHHLACRCVGADESCFATFIATAAEGEREDALMAMLLVRADMAPCLTALAQDFGLALRRMVLRGRAPHPTPSLHAANDRLH